MMNSMSRLYTQTKYEKDDAEKKRKNTNYAGLMSVKATSESSGSLAIGTFLTAASALALLAV